MTGADLSPPGTPKALGPLARDLQREFEGRFGEETILQLLVDSYWALAARATVTNWLVLNAEVFARQRLQALAHAEAPPPDRTPAVLFMCSNNAGRSQMALGFFDHLAQGRAVAWSAGAERVPQVHPAVVAAMDAIGIDIAKEFPKPLAEEFLSAADVIVTMGCGDSCPLVAGKRYEDWQLDDPTGKSVDQIGPIRDEIGRKVHDLLQWLGVLSAPG